MPGHAAAAGPLPGPGARNLERFGAPQRWPCRAKGQEPIQKAAMPSPGNGPAPSRQSVAPRGGHAEYPGLGRRPVRAAPFSRASDCWLEKTVLFLCWVLSGSRRLDAEPRAGCWVPGETAAPASAGEMQLRGCGVGGAARGDTAGTGRHKMGGDPALGAPQGAGKGQGGSVNEPLCFGAQGQPYPCTCVRACARVRVCTRGCVGSRQ